MTQAQAVKRWLDSAKQDVEVAEGNYKMGYYTWTLFLWHLAIEKTLKAIISQNKIPPPIHNLVKLAKLANIQLSVVQKKDLQEITAFNLDARYDSEKLDFHKKTTKQFTTLWQSKSKDLYLWLLNQL